MITFNPAPDRALVERHSPLIASYRALIARAARSEGLALTRTGRFGRAVIAEAAAAFPFPGHDTAALAAHGAAPEERRVPPLAALRGLMLELGLAQAEARRLRATEAGTALGADPGAAFATLVPALLFGPSQAGANRALPGDWGLFLSVLDREAGAGISARALAAALYGIRNPEPAHALFENVLRPLGWAGLITPPPRAADPRHRFARTPLWHDALHLPARTAAEEDPLPLP